MYAVHFRKSFGMHVYRRRVPKSFGTQVYVMTRGCPLTARPRARRQGTLLSVPEGWRRDGVLTPEASQVASGEKRTEKRRRAALRFSQDRPHSKAPEHQPPVTRRCLDLQRT